MLENERVLNGLEPNRMARRLFFHLLAMLEYSKIDSSLSKEVVRPDLLLYSC